MTPLEKLKQCRDMCREAYRQYSSQIQLCNSDQSTVNDFKVLSEIKRNWEYLTDQLSTLEYEYRENLERSTRLYYNTLAAKYFDDYDVLYRESRCKQYYQVVYLRKGIKETFTFTDQYEAKKKFSGFEIIN
ncbi:MAG: hypothetical protein ACK566_00665 [Bacteroidota bacterium]|jgi:hypothetical protein